MNWEAVGAIGEILGALTVVVTLVYLARQIRQNTRVARSSTRQSIAEMTVSGDGMNLTNDAELAALVLKDLKHEPLSEVENIRVMARAYTTMRTWENIHYQYLTGMLTRDEWEGFRRNLVAIMKWDSIRRYWSNEKHYYSRAFPS